MNFISNIRHRFQRFWKRRSITACMRKRNRKGRAKALFIEENAYIREIEKACYNRDKLKEVLLCQSRSYPVLTHSVSHSVGLFEIIENSRSSSIDCSRYSDQIPRNDSSTFSTRKSRKSCRLRRRSGKFNQNLKNYTSVRSAADASQGLIGNEGGDVGILAQHSVDSCVSSKQRSILDQHSVDSNVGIKQQSIPDLLETGGHQYCKYIPIKENLGALYPKSPVDEQFPSCWLDIYTWYKHYLDGKYSQQNTVQSRNIHQSCSDTVISKRSNISLKTFIRYSSGHSEWLHSELRDEVSVEESDALWNHPRFGMISNLEYMSYVNQLIHYQTKVRVQFLLAAHGSPHQCRNKTEMILSCLNSFFHNGGDKEVFWTKNFIQHLPTRNLELIFPHNIASILAMQLTQARGVLFVTREAALLIRHPDVCFLDTLAVTAGLQRKELVVLPYELGPGQSAQCLELQEMIAEDEDSSFLP